MDVLETLMNSSDVRLVSAYESRNAEFRILPSKLVVTLPKFTPEKINTEYLKQQLGYLSSLSIEIEERGLAKYKPLIDVPLINAKIQTEKNVKSVACLSDEDIWMHDNSNLKLYNLQTGHVRSIKTRPGTCLEDISVTKDGDLVYIGYNDRSVNIVKNTHIESVIKLQGWIPRGVCSTLSGELLVVVQSADDDQQSKVVRYSGSEEKPSIQFNDNKKPLYSSGGDTKYISENKNLDICVSDWGPVQ